MSDTIRVYVVAEGVSRWSLVAWDVAELLVAATAADPETWRDMREALGRWMPLEQAETFFDSWAWGELDRTDGSWLWLDLAGRRLECSEPEALFHGECAAVYHDQSGPTSILLSYCVPPYWTIDGSQPGDLSADVREVLYGELVSFIVERSHEAIWGPDGLLVARQIGERSLEDWLASRDGRDAMRSVHVDWLDESRLDLVGFSPRQILGLYRAFIERDIRNQQHYWTMRLEQPPGVRRDSRAYRTAPFGSHETVLYHRLVRLLVTACWDELLAHGEPVRDKAELESYLRQIQQEWTNTPDETLLGKTPAYLIDRERARLPVAVSGEEMMIDCNCPVCQMMADSQIPGFWYLDDADLEDYFDDEWYLNSGISLDDLDELDNPVDTSDSATAARSVTAAGGSGAVDDPIDSGPSGCEVGAVQRVDEGLRRQATSELNDELDGPTMWRSSFVNMKLVAKEPVSIARSILALGIAGHVAELMGDLKAECLDIELLGQLTESFAEVRKAIANQSSWEVRSAVAGLIGHLETVSERCRPLADKCDDLQSKLELFACMADDGA